MEVWGAERGYRSSSTYAGKGGYSYGTINFNKGDELYIHVGGSGNSGTCTNSICKGGYNGGGYRYSYKGGGGGSGYVWTSSTASSVPSGYSVDTKYYLTDAATVAGNTSFTQSDGSTATGKSGNGYARITYLGE